MSSEVRDITDKLAKSEAIAIISRTKYQQTRQNNVPPYHRENYNAQWDELKYMWQLKRASMLFFSSFMMTLIYSRTYVIITCLAGAFTPVAIVISGAKTITVRITGNGYTYCNTNCYSDLSTFVNTLDSIAGVPYS